MGCGQPFISVTPANNETILSDAIRRIGVLEQTKADARLVGEALVGQQKQIDALKPTAPEKK